VAAQHDSRDSRTTLESITRSYSEYRRELLVFFARRSRDPAAGEDLVQLVYERLIRYRPRSPIRDPVRYLFQTARRVLLDANRQTRRDQDLYQSCDARELDNHAQNSQDLWVQDESTQVFAQEELERVLAQLPRNCQIALIRHRRDGRTYRQIGSELGVSPHTVKDYIVKALGHVRRHFAMDSAGKQKGNPHEDP
jgi:RNA polymerase sigma factor (sigma-70 family)